MLVKKKSPHKQSAGTKRLSTTTLGQKKIFSIPVLAVLVVILSILGYFVISTFAARPPGDSSSSCSKANGITGVWPDAANEVNSRGVAPVYSQGRKLRSYVRLCMVRGFRVNAVIATNLNDMIMSAQRQGITLSSKSRFSGWRSYNMQREIRAINGCPDDRTPPSACTTNTAVPGTSNHELGMALDFNNSTTRNYKVYKWLNKNASRFGFYNLPSEPWHWSRNGR